MLSAKQLADNTKEKRVYGRRTGRPLNKERLALLESILPAIEIPQDKLKETGKLAPQELFGCPCPELVFEIGFGNGEHLAEMMRRNPKTFYIGAEPFINGMSAFTKDIKDDPHEKIRVLMDDAMMVANSLEDACVDSIYVLNPDPWHKKRHFKRRIISKDNLDQFARIMKPGGMLIMSTDVPDLADWMIMKASNHPEFEWTAEKADDWRKAPKDWITTRYEQKGAKGASSMSYMVFRRK